MMRTGKVEVNVKVIYNFQIKVITPGILDKFKVKVIIEDFKKSVRVNYLIYLSVCDFC
jgi:hypothetical protein